MEFPGEALVLKLWDTLTEKGIGKLLSPWQTRRDGRAHAQVRADEMLLLAQAEADANDLRAGRKRLHEDGSRLIAVPVNSPLRLEGSEHSNRVEPTLNLASLAESAHRQDVVASMRAEINTSRSVLFAEEVLRNSTGETSSEPVDDDWLSTWRDHASKVSSEDLQRLWGSVLAGEVKNPGQYSLRTLDFLRTLSRNEAELISMLGPFAIGSRIYKTESDYLEKKGITFDALLQLQDLGIVTGVDGLGLQATFNTVDPGKFLVPLIAGNRVLIIERENPEPSLDLPAYILTKLGLQVLSLGHFSLDTDYLKMVGRRILQQGLKVSLGDWVQVSRNEGRYFNLEPILP